MLPKPLILLPAFGLLLTLSLWVLDPVLQVFDRTRIADLTSNRRRHYTVITDDQYFKSPGKASVDLSVIFPAYNEEKRITKTLETAIKFLQDWTVHRSWSFEIIVVDDGGSDATSTVALSFYQKYPDIFRVIKLRRNQGKGGAIKVGVEEAFGKYILMADADGATDIEDLDMLMKEMDSLEADSSLEVGFVLGSRAHLAEKSIATREFYRTVLMKGFHLLVMMLCTRQIQDTQCGFKLFTRNVAKKLFGNLHLYGWAFDIDIIYQAEALGIAMKEVSVNWKEIEGSKLIKSKLDVVTTSLTMARDMLAVRLAYVLGFWHLAVDQPLQRNDEL